MSTKKYNETNLGKFWKESVWTGYNIAGGEFAGGKGGIPGINYPAYFPKEYAKWAHENGINSLRLCVTLERLFPSQGINNAWSTNEAYAKSIKDFLVYCEQYKIKCFLDLHQYAEYFFTGKGGFTSNLLVPKSSNLHCNLISNNYKIINNEVIIHNGSTNDYCFETAIFGELGNPYAPAQGYKFAINLKVASTKSKALLPNEVWEGVMIYAMYIDDNNHYRLYWNDSYFSTNVTDDSSPLSLEKVVNGKVTKLGRYNLPLNSNIGTSHNFEIDVNILGSGNVLIKLDGNTIITALHDNRLNKGQVGVRSLNSILNISYYQLDIEGDINSNPFKNPYGDEPISDLDKGKIRWGKTAGGIAYDTNLHKKFYQRVVEEFDKFPGLEGYMYNEPRGFSVGDGYTYEEGTHPDTYRTTAICTRFNQAAIDEIRRLGSTKWYGWASDDYQGLQNMYTTKWGANYDIPWNDPIDKTFIDCHYYTDKYSNYPATSFNFSHSGTYGAIGWRDDLNTWDPVNGSGNHTPFTTEEMKTHMLPFLNRLAEINRGRVMANRNPVPVVISELGAPIEPIKGALAEADYVRSLDDAMRFLRANNCGFMYFAIGPTCPNDRNGLFAGIQTSNEITDPNDPNKKIEIVSLNSSNDIRHQTIKKYLNN